MNRSFIRICAIIVLCCLFVSGCGSSSSSSSSSDSQEVIFSDYAMMINSRFQPIALSAISDRRLAGSLIGAYSIPSPSTDYFEKNIVIYEDVLGSLSFDNYVSQALRAIDTTRWWYKRDDLTSFNIPCGESSLPAQKHLFHIIRGPLNGTGQTVYFVQYFFAKWNKITILSTSTDDDADLDTLKSYGDTIQCNTGSMM